MVKSIDWTEKDHDPGKCPLPPVISDSKFRAFITDQDEASHKRAAFEKYGCYKNQDDIG